jgi:hypothetical protein
MSGAAGLRVQVDPTTDTGHVLLSTTVIDEEGATTINVRLTPANAYKVAQMLVTAAESMEMP